MKTFQVIDSSEYEEFIRSIKQEGYNLNDFELLEHREPRKTVASIEPIVGSVTIKHLKRGTLPQTYPAGHGYAWTVAFHRDLQAGVHGKP